MKLEALRAALLGVSAYKGLLGEPVASALTELLDCLAAGRNEAALHAYTEVFYRLRAGDWMGLGDYFWDRLRYGESPYPKALERGRADPALEQAAQRDVETFALLSALDCDSILERLHGRLGEHYTAVLAALPRWTAGAPFTFDSLRDFYAANGYGLFARYRAFLWERGSLHPIPDPDCASSSEMLGYELQRGEVLTNTRAMLAGSPVNNVLLYGDSGTGKSATVKSLLAAAGFEHLRIIEIAKETLSELPTLIRQLDGRRQKFILFIDDLAFDKDDHTYSVLKTILEGGLEKRPANVAIYATSNRRNLVRQTFSDRAGDEVDRSETISEKTSLAERFGLRVAYLPLGKPEFLDMVERMADLYGIQMESHLLRAEAVKWEMHHPGKTPRTARQFIASLSL